MTSTQISDQATAGSPDTEWLLALFPPVGDPDEPRTRTVQSLLNLVDRPQDELEALIGVMAQGRVIDDRVWHQGLTVDGSSQIDFSVDNEAPLPFGDADADNFLAMFANYDSDADKALLDSVDAGDVVLVTDAASPDQWLAFRVAGTDYASGADANAKRLWFADGDVVYRAGLNAYDEGWAAGDTAKVYIVKQSLDLDGQNATGATAVTQSSEIPVRAPGGKYENKSIGHLNDHFLPVRTKPRTLSATYETTATDITAESGLIHALQHPGSQTWSVFWGIRDDEALDGGGSMPAEDIEAILTFHHKLTIKSADGSKSLKGSITGYGGGGAYRYQVQLGGGTKTGAAFADGEAIKVVLQSALVDRDEFVEAVFGASETNVAGRAGAAGKIWAYLSSATNAGWRRLLDVLKADADTAAKKADYRAALATGRVEIDIAGGAAVALTDANAASSALRLTGVRTADAVLSVPDAAAGVLQIEHDATGDYMVSVKAASQAAGAAVRLERGPNLLLLKGGSIARVRETPDPPTAGTHRTATYALAAGDIGKWNSFKATAAIEVSLSGALGSPGDRLVLACRSMGNNDIDLRWVDGTLKVYSTIGIATLTAAGSTELIGSGGNQRAVFTAIKTGATEWTLYEGVWAAT